MSVYNDKKTDEVIFTAVDSIYYKRYGSVWGWSIYKNGMHGHIHVIDPSSRDIKNLERLEKYTMGKIKFSTGDIDSNLPRDKCYFASFRFLYVSNLASTYNKVLITDVDSIIKENICFPSEDFGFFERDPLQSNEDWFRESSKLAAGIFYIDLQKTKEFNLQESYQEKLDLLREQGKWRWMVDQNALFEVFDELNRLNRFEIKKFNPSYLCWDFKESSLIWTGKGSRKYKSYKYLKEFKKNLKQYQKTIKLSYSDQILDFIDKF